MQIKGSFSNIKEIVGKKGTFYVGDFVASDDATCEMQCRVNGQALKDAPMDTPVLVDLASVGLRTREWNGQVSVSLEGKVRSVKVL